MTQFAIHPDAEAVCAAMADRVVETAVAAIDEGGIFRIALSGGGTPKTVYPKILEPGRRDQVDWSRVEFFWGDERTVPPDDPESNFGVAYRMLIAHLPGVRPDRVHRMQAEAPDLDLAALSYESAPMGDVMSIFTDSKVTRIVAVPSAATLVTFSCCT